MHTVERGRCSPRKYQVIKPLKVVFYGSSHLNYTGELFPTEIRGNALSIRALFGSIATILTPLVLNMKQHWVSYLFFIVSHKIISKLWNNELSVAAECCNGNTLLYDCLRIHQNARNSQQTTCPDD